MINDTLECTQCVDSMISTRVRLGGGRGGRSGEEGSGEYCKVYKYYMYPVHRSDKLQHIDQFHVLRYCFLNNALCLSGSYDCT